MSRINYKLTKIKAIAFDIDGVLSPSTIPMGADGIPQRMANIKDGYAMQLAVKHGLRLCIISGAKAPGLAERYRMLGMTDIFLGASEKLDVLKAWMDENGLFPDEVAFVGDDIPDLRPMQYVGLPVAPRDAAHEVKEAALFITKANGGYGVARELLEDVMRAQNLWLDQSTAFGW